MRPVRVAMTAFGPYAAEQVVDFRSLNGRTFFLIHGATGAGKTTLLDAICFALYGDTSGAEREGRQMRSAHAKPSCLTEVILDFALGTRCYRVRRVPDQERPKAQGKGTTRQKSDATLWDRTGLTDDKEDGLPLATGVSEVEREVERMLGFKSDQFRQVVILPQGKFRQLLSANSTERESILKTLFRTEWYERITEALKSEAKRLAEDLSRLRADRTLLLAQVSAASEEALAQEQGRLEDEASVLTASLETLRGSEDKALGAWQDGKAVAQKLAEAEAARKDEAELRNQASSMEELRARLAAAQRALVLNELVAVVRARRDEASRVQKAVVTAHEREAEATEAYRQAEVAHTAERDRETERDKARQQVVSLEGQRAALARLKEAQASLRAAHKATVDGRTKQGAAQKALEDASKQHETSQQARATAALLAQGLETRQQQRSVAQKLLEQRQKLDKATNDLQEAEALVGTCDAARDAAAEKLRLAQEERERLEARWYQQQAARIAATLVPGEPCAVCGSEEHPAPAPPPEGGPLLSEADLDQAKRNESQQRDALDQAQRRLDAKRVAVKTLQTEQRLYTEALGAQATVPKTHLEQALQEAEAALTKASEAAQQLPGVEATLADATKRLAAAGDAAKKADDLVQEALRAEGEAQTRVSEREEGLPEGLREQAALDAAVRTAEATREALLKSWEEAQQRFDKTGRELATAQATLSAHDEEAGRAEEALREAEAHFRQRLSEAGFESEEAHRQAACEPQVKQRWEDQLGKHDEALATARLRVGQAEQAVQGLAQPDLSALEGAYQLAKRQIEEAVRRQGEVATRQAQLADCATTLSANNQEIQAKDARFAIVGRLARVANGESKDSRVTFQRFVLASLLEKVLLNASERLKLMSDGRYRLQRKVEVSDSRRATGLDLEVFDLYTGTARNVSTLSGGEGFQAALSLALGLADEVQRYAGGVQLESLFVDEGFGSLDANALDLAMRSLQDLQQQGRMVGIISHVNELKEWIPTRLEVTPSRAGSAAAFVLD